MSFKDILAWQKAHDLCVFVYQDFRTCKDYAFKDQIQRAAVSVMNNIAEGHAKRSDKSFKSFLLISKGSLAEVQSMLILVAVSLDYMDEGTMLKRFALAEETGRITSGLIKKLSSQINGS